MTKTNYLSAKEVLKDFIPFEFKSTNSLEKVCKNIQKQQAKLFSLTKRLSAGNCSNRLDLYVKRLECENTITGLYCLCYEMVMENLDLKQLHEKCYRQWMTQHQTDFNIECKLKLIKRVLLAS